MNILVSFDSFNGALAPSEATAMVAKAMRDRLHGNNIYELPVADGTRDSLYAIKKSIGGEYITPIVPNPYMEPVAVKCLVSHDTFVIDVSEWLNAKTASLNTKLSSTYGLGELLKVAAERGAKRIIIASSKSFTLDGGAGMLASLGATFVDAEGFHYIPNRKTLGELYSIDVSSLTKSLDGIEIIVIPDTDMSYESLAFENPGLRTFADMLSSVIGADYRDQTATATCGGTGLAIKPLFGATFVSGFTALSEVADLSPLIERADLVITNLLDKKEYEQKNIADLADEYDVPVFYILDREHRYDGSITAETLYSEATELADRLKSISG